MRVLLATLLLGALVVTGCARQKASQAPPSARFAAAAGAPPSSSQRLIVTPASSLVGKVEQVNQTSRFAVVNFATGQVPEQGRVMSVYRNGLKVGELRVNGPRLDGNQVADLVAGDAVIGDEVREN